ncbi:MAG: carboxypeptidase regulatory-like domain-containing protein [Planctomycetes bacterium]|nr:carboxypeptidase regulatory-like domain-containing protein [Planctomycetota bacterium]
MNRWAGVGLCLLGLGAGLWLLAPWRETLPPVPPQPTSVEPNGTANVATASSPAAADPTRTSEPIRVEPPPERIEPVAPQHAQGLRGVVVDERAQPLPGRKVFLVDSAANDPLALPLLKQQRDAFGPLASCDTGPDGSFAVGLPVAQDRTYEVYVVSDAHATARISGLRLLPGKWHQLDTITLVAGALLRGRVSVAGRDDIPVPNASIVVEIGTAFADAALRALPGAASGLCATTDTFGNYELRHVPSRGVVQVSAVAAGFARQIKGNIEVSTTNAVVVDFALPPGKILAGTCNFANGQPVANATVEAWPQQAAGGPLLARSDEQGRFNVLGLLAGLHRVRVVARGCQPRELTDVEPGRTDLQFTLVELSRLRVRVQSDRGEVLRSYQLALRRVFPGHADQIAKVLEVPEQRVRLDGATDTVEVAGVPEGTFVCQVEAEGYAKTLSAPFDNTRPLGSEPIARTFDVDVTMTLGGTLRGVVLDERGQPLAGAILSTQADGRLPDNPFERLLASALPERITATHTTTAADGSFALRHLAHAGYQLLVEHAEACRTVVPGLKVLADDTVTLPPIRLQSGARVRGVATVAGRIAGQMKVVLTTPTDLADPKLALRLETVTEPDGTFAFARRVPAGRYDLRAAVVGTGEPEAQIFREISQLNRSTTTVTVPTGQHQVECSIDLPSDH